jgi:hypothetical protein
LLIKTGWKVRKSIQCVGLIAAIVMGILTAAGTAQAAVPPGYNEIIARHSEKCLDVAVAGRENGRPTIQSGCWQGTNQQWSFVDRGNDWVAIVVWHTGKCLDVAGASLDQGAIVVQAGCHFGGNQLWKIDREATPFFRLIVQHTGKCLDIAGADQSDGASAIQSFCHDGTNQQFRMNRIG